MLFSFHVLNLFVCRAHFAEGDTAIPALLFNLWDFSLEEKEHCEVSIAPCKCCETIVFLDLFAHSLQASPAHLSIYKNPPYVLPRSLSLLFSLTLPLHLSHAVWFSLCRLFSQDARLGLEASLKVLLHEQTIGERRAARTAQDELILTLRRGYGQHGHDE